MKCNLCDREIDQERLDVLPTTRVCFSCAALNPPKKVKAKDVDLSQASPIDRTGFGVTD